MSRMNSVTESKRRGRAKRFGVGILLASMLLSPILQAVPVSAAGPADTPVTLLSEEPITSGAILKKYEWKFDRKNQPVKVNANVVQVDLQNPLVKLDTIAGTNGQFTKKQSVRDMANETGAVAAVNGDFYNTQAEGVPMGPQISNGKLLATPPYLPGFYSFALTKENKPVVDLFTFEGKIVAQDGATYPLGGINKTYYWFENDGWHEEGKHSHIDGLFMYTNAWGQVDRSNDGVTVPTEVLVQNGIIKEIALSGIIRMVAPPDGYILRASGKADEFVRQHLKVGDKLVADYRVMAQDPNKNYDVANFKMMIGGHTIMVDEGKPAAWSRDVSDLAGYRSRTAIGYSKDQRYVYLITADNRDDSKGLSMTELQYFMIKIGVWKGLNLDGGGSTQMVVRPLGEKQVSLVNRTEYSDYERKVVNGVGVWSLAPKGEAKGITIQGPNIVFLKEKTAYSMKGYDIYYNPIDTASLPAQWSTSQPIGTFEGNTFIAQKPGKTTLTVVSGQAKSSMDVEVVGRDQLASLKIQPSSSALLPNAIYKLSVVATTRQGITRTVPPEALQWEMSGFKGRLEGDKLTVESIDPGAKEGRLIARYDGFTTMVTLPVEEQRIAVDFEKDWPAVSFKSIPAEVTGTARRVAGVPGTPSGQFALSLSYDFTGGTGTKVAYAVLGGDAGLPVAGEPVSMSVKVKGDKSYNWVRAEIIDGKGEQKLIDFTRELNWTDWKTLTADLKAYNVAYPITLKKLYVANPATGQDERAAKGEVWFDDVSFQYKTGQNQPRNKVTLAINKKSMTVNGTTMLLDQAPVLYKDNTLVPVRFIVEAMGGEVSWNDAERKVTVVKDGHMAEMWLGKTELIIDGEVVTAEVAPMLMTERTMVPLRLLSEKFGWTVGWDQSTYSITLE